jgi:hypothetical protein
VLSQRTKTHFAAKGRFAMAVAEILSGPQPESFHRTQLRRAIIASTVGTTIEWYDFLLYSVVTGLVFAGSERSKRSFLKWKRWHGKIQC